MDIITNVRNVSAEVKAILLESSWEMLKHTETESYNGEIWTTINVEGNDYTVCINHDGFVDISFDDFEDDMINIIVAVLGNKKLIKQIYSNYNKQHGRA